jgi:hypothetical protein
MENSENTHQIPESVENKIQEENSSTVETTEIPTESKLPTDPGQATDKIENEEFQQDLQAVPEEVQPVAEQENITDDQPVEVVDAGDNAPESVPVVQAEISPEIPDTPEAEPGEIPVPVDEITAEIPESGEDHSEEDILEDVTEHEIHESEEDLENCTREQLIDLLEKAVNDTDVSAVKTRIALIKVAFLKKKKEENLQKYDKFMEDGGTKEDFAIEKDPLDDRFNEIFNIYKTNKARYSEEQEKIKLSNLTKKQQILDELKHLVSSEETLKKTYDEFRTLQDRWKEIGMVPRNEINNLWQNYHFLVEKFFDKVKLNKELKDLDLKKNLEAKIALCEKTEELLLETSILKSFKKLQKYHEEWKEIGPVPADKKDEIWERFKNATDKINERRREHYTRVEDEQQKNLETKTALCEQVEEIVNINNETIKDWQETTNKVNDLLMIWKGIGTVPQKFNSDIWNRFKTNLDNFFSNKKEFFDKLKEQQIHNYNIKVDLCVQAEALKGSNDWRKTSNELIRLQNEWKKIGPVPKKHSDKIWKRFRAACDEFFTAKQNYFSNVQAHEEENLNKKVDLINRLKEYNFSENKSENLECLKNFQREWTEIGHIPIKEKDRLQNEFRVIINEHLDRLKISEVEISTVNFQSRMEALKNDPQSRRLITREKEILFGKISKMKEDINLWENNIGFLADSKNAAILKQEFEKKINKAKTELKVMEAKLKILKSQ